MCGRALLLGCRFVRLVLCTTGILAVAATLAASPPPATSGVTRFDHGSTTSGSVRSVTLRRDSSGLALLDEQTGSVVQTLPLDTPGPVVIHGIEGNHTDTLTVDLRGGFDIPQGISYEAGVGGFDTLRILHEPANRVRLDYEQDDARGHRGTVVVDGTVIRYSGIEPIDMTGSSIANLVINLPSGTTGASLEDDGSPGNGAVRIASTDATFETTTFSVPSGSLIINGGGGTDTIVTSADFSGDFNASLIINGTSATDIITLGALTLGNGGANAGTISVTGRNINVTGTLDTTTGTSGQVDLSAGQSIALIGGGITTTGGAVTLSANQGAVPFSGAFYGIRLIASTITSENGPILLHGKGGDAGGANDGVVVQGASTISSTGTGASAAPVTLLGEGGLGTASNIGVFIGDPGTMVTSIDGAIHLSGMGAAASGNVNAGVAIALAGKVSSVGAATVTIDGIGGGSGSSDGNYGVLIYASSAGVPATVTSATGAINVTGTPGIGAASHGIEIGLSGGTISSTGTAPVTLTAPSMAFDTSNALIGGGSSLVTLRPVVAGTTIGLGLPVTRKILLDK